MKRWLDRPGTAWLFGVGVPIAMVVLDPAVFRASVIGIDRAILGQFKALGYTGIALSVAALAAAIRLSGLRAPLAGALAGSCGLSLVLGACILPYSLLGILFVGVGLLGLTPFLSGLVLGWRAVRTYQQASPAHRLPLAAAGLVVFLAVPAGVQWVVSSEYRTAIREIVSGDAGGLERGAVRLRRWRLLLDSDQLIDVWNAQLQRDRKERVAVAYERAFGGDIATGARRLRARSGRT